MAKSWNLPDRDATPEKIARRSWLRRAGLLGLGAAGIGGVYYFQRAGTDQEVLSTTPTDDRGAIHYPGSLNAEFSRLDRSITAEAHAARYCNFYEFSSGKSVWRYVDPFSVHPWSIDVCGLVTKPRVYDMDDVHKTFALEERLYRHRCVETWAMAVPWTGFPLAELIRKAEPLPGAKFVRFVSFMKPEEASRQRDRGLPWPYAEGLSLAEATNPLTFVATGMYGHPLLKQHGAPLRLVVPWKYGFKSAKSIVRIELVSDQPSTFWNTLSPREYDFWANVNPQIPHPRWSQANERMLGTGESRPTQLYNGYAEWVARLYA